MYVIPVTVSSREMHDLFTRDDTEHVNLQKITLVLQIDWWVSISPDSGTTINCVVTQTIGNWNLAARMITNTGFTAGIDTIADQNYKEWMVTSEPK